MQDVTLDVAINITQEFPIDVDSEMVSGCHAMLRVL